MDIETDKAYFRMSDLLRSCAAVRCWINSSQRNPRYSDLVVGRSILREYDVIRLVAGVAANWLTQWPYSNPAVAVR